MKDPHRPGLSPAEHDLPDSEHPAAGRVHARECRIGRPRRRDVNGLTVLEALGGP
jgi:hypothetical protein